MDNLTPTLWKTCRMLSHAGRLACLRMVIQRPGLCVGMLAQELDVPENYASIMLRALQARGLIRAVRQSRWVYYYPLPDPMVASAAPILQALSQKLLDEGVTEKSIIRILTAFTHPRRLSILCYLRDRRVATSKAMSPALNISQQALSRHLTKLAMRGLIKLEGQFWRFIPSTDYLVKTLLTEAAKTHEI